MLVVSQASMLEHVYEMYPDETPESVDGVLLLLVCDDAPDSICVSDHIVDRATRFKGASEFVVSVVEPSHGCAKGLAADEYPALFHFVSGTLRETTQGMDDCLEFYAEFVRDKKWKH